MLKTLTVKQAAVFEKVIETVYEKLYQPSRQDLADHFGVTVHAITSHFRALIKKGWFDYGKSSVRAAHVTDEALKVYKEGRINEFIEGYEPEESDAQSEQEKSIKKLEETENE
jgi:predicted transcriptional regulator